MEAKMVILANIEYDEQSAEAVIRYTDAFLALPAAVRADVYRDLSVQLADHADTAEAMIANGLSRDSA